MSSLRKWFSSNSMLRIVQIYFCLTAIGTFVQAEYYKVSSLNTMNLKNLRSDPNQRSENQLNIGGSAFLFIKRDKNSYTAQLEETDISTNYFEPDISVSECGEFKPVATALRKPFKVLLNDNGQFKSIKVSKDDVDLSIALKFLVATSLQVNKKKLQQQGKIFRFRDIAVSQYGNCAEVIAGAKDSNGNYEYRSITRQDCIGLESSASKDDQQFADSTCRTDNLKIRRQFSVNHQITFNPETNEFKNLEVQSILFYFPNKNSEDFLSTFSKVKFELNPTRLGEKLEKRKGSNRDPEPFNDADSKELIMPQYIKIDRSMVQGPNSNKAFLFYKGLACQPFKKNTQLAVLRIAARCYTGKRG